MAISFAGWLSVPRVLSLGHGTEPNVSLAIYGPMSPNEIPSATPKLVLAKPYSSFHVVMTRKPAPRKRAPGHPRLSTI